MGKFNRKIILLTILALLAICQSAKLRASASEKTETQESESGVLDKVNNDNPGMGPWDKKDVVVPTPKPVDPPKPKKLYPTFIHGGRNFMYSCSLKMFQWSNSSGGTLTTNCNDYNYEKNRRTFDLNHCFTTNEYGSLIYRTSGMWKNLNHYCKDCDINLQTGFLKCTCTYNTYTETSEINLNIHIGNSNSYLFLGALFALIT